MSNPYSTGDLDTLPKWNAILVSCCCEMPEPLAVDEEFQTRTFTEEALLYPPFEEPAGGDDERPNLYGSKDSDDAFNREQGQAEYYQGWTENPTIPNEWAESLQIMTFPSGGGSVVAITGNTTEDDDGSHSDPVSSGTSSGTLFAGLFGGTPFFPDYEGSSDSSEEITPAQITVTWTTWRDKSAVMRYQRGTLGLALQGAGGDDDLGILVWDITYGYGYTGYELTGEKTPAELIGDAAAGAAGETWAAGGIGIAGSFLDWPTIGELKPWPAAADAWDIAQQAVSATATPARHRWSVPASHTGTWFKVMWDIIEEPDGWDATPPTAARSFVSQDNVWEWNDPESRTSDWYEIAAPSVPGTRRIVNRRVWCYRGPYGSLPILVGEQVTI